MTLGPTQRSGLTTLSTLLRAHSSDPRRVLYRLEDGTSVSYAEQLRRSEETATGLRASGARPGDRVHVALGNCPEFLDLWFATALSGTVLVPTNPQASGEELAHTLADAQPAIIVSNPEQARALRWQPDGAPDVEPGPVSSILYTSGTTSRAKGVMITARNLVGVGAAVAEHLSMTEGDRWLVVLPMFHANAQFYCGMSALVSGGSLALPTGFSASRWGQQAHEMGATLGSLFAAPVRMILARSEGVDQRCSLRAVLYAQNLTPTAARIFEQRFGTRLVQLYGMTETVVPPTMNPLSEDRRWDSIGRPLPGVVVDLVQQDGGVDPGSGEMRIRGTYGDTLAAGYWGDPVATAETFTEEGLRTGDLATRGKGGFLYFVDRVKDVIKRSGENISASEVERIINQHEAVLDCAVVGVPDEMRDEAVAVAVVIQPGGSVTEVELAAWCRERLSGFKVPSVFRFMESLPRTSVGKIRKVELRARLTDASQTASTPKPRPARTGAAPPGPAASSTAVQLFPTARSPR